MNDDKRWVVDALVLWFVVVRSAGSGLNRRTGIGVSGVGVEDAVAAAGVGVCVAVAGGADGAGVGGTNRADIVSGPSFAVAVGDVGVGGVGVEGASDVKDVGSLDGAAAADAKVIVSISTDGVDVESIGVFAGAAVGNDIAGMGGTDSANIADVVCVVVAVVFSGGDEGVGDIDEGVVVATVLGSAKLNVGGVGDVIIAADVAVVGIVNSTDVVVVGAVVVVVDIDVTIWFFCVEWWY